METRDFRKLNVQKKAHHFPLQGYRITKNFPSDKRFGLTVRMLNSFITKLTANG
ncbi:MAG: four helix bundle protein [Deltaproteobacteria bacterium]|nr:four helix bundle protein [Deltaproteobacteria bacterium]